MLPLKQVYRSATHIFLLLVVLFRLSHMLRDSFFSIFCGNSNVGENIETVSVVWFTITHEASQKSKLWRYFFHYALRAK